MLFSLAFPLFLITLSNALSLDSTVHHARHQHIAGVKRSSVKARCQERSLNSTKSTSSTPKPAPSIASSSPSSSSSSAKGGLSWTDGDSSGMKNFVTDKVSTVYNWGVVKPTEVPSGLNYVPMLWGNDESRLTQFKNIVKAGYANTVMAYNEPDIPSQSNIDPVTAAQLWMQVGDPLRQQGYTIVSPAVAFNTTWLQIFFENCKGCEFHYLAAHIYTTSSEDLITYLTDLHKTFNLPIYVTEFAYQSFNGAPQATSQDQVNNFAMTVTQWFEETDFIAKYFPYSVLSANNININAFNALMNDNSETPTPLAGIYFGT